MPYPVVPLEPTLGISQYPNGAVPINNGSGNKAATTAAATLAGVAGKTTYITGFSITGSGATAASVVTATVSDGTWTLSYTIAVAAGVTAANQPLLVTFDPPLPASAADTAITVSCPSLGSGNTNCTVNAQGYQL